MRFSCRYIVIVAAFTSDASCLKALVAPSGSSDWISAIRQLQQQSHQERDRLQQSSPPIAIPPQNANFHDFDSGLAIRCQKALEDVTNRVRSVSKDPQKFDTPPSEEQVSDDGTRGASSNMDAEVSCHRQDGVDGAATTGEWESQFEFDAEEPELVALIVGSSVPSETNTAEVTRTESMTPVEFPRDYDPNDFNSVYSSSPYELPRPPGRDPNDTDHAVESCKVAAAASSPTSKLFSQRTHTSRGSMDQQRHFPGEEEGGKVVQIPGIQEKCHSEISSKSNDDPVDSSSPPPPPPLTSPPSVPGSSLHKSLEPFRVYSADPSKPGEKTVETFWRFDRSGNSQVPKNQEMSATLRNALRTFEHTNAATKDQHPTVFIGDHVKVKTDDNPAKLPSGTVARIESRNGDGTYNLQVEEK